VYPAASLATRYPRPDALIVEINPEETPLSSYAGIVLRARAAAVLPAILETEPGEFVSLREQ
jgi:NAD-dependent deacetylase